MKATKINNESSGLLFTRGSDETLDIGLNVLWSWFGNVKLSIWITKSFGDF